MDRKTYETLLRIRDNPIVRDHPLSDGLTPDEESLVKAGLLDKHDIDRDHGTYTVSVSLKGREALEGRTLRGRLRRALGFLLTPLGAIVNAILSSLAGFVVAKLLGQ